MWKIHIVAGISRVGASDEWPGFHWGERRDGVGAGGPGYCHGVPKLCPVSAYECAEEYWLPPAVGENAEGGDCGEGRGDRPGFGVVGVIGSEA